MQDDGKDAGVYAAKHAARSLRGVALIIKQNTVFKSIAFLKNYNTAELIC